MPAPGTLVVAIESMPQDLDPRFASDAASSRIGDLVFRGLTRRDAGGRPEPDLATGWRLDGATRVVFRLREGVTFHDGSPLSATDVRATYASILDPATGSPKRGELADVEGVDAPDERTVVFRLRRPNAAFFEATKYGVLPEDEVRRPRSRIGAGAFAVDRVEGGREVRLVARDPAAPIREIRFRVVPDDTVRTLELARGSVHFVENAIEPENLGWLASGGRACVERAPGTTFQYLGMNLDDPRLRDPRVRRAIAHALDRRALLDGLFGGLGRVANGLFPPEHWVHEPSARVPEYDPEAAKHLLDEAGLRDPDGDGPAVRTRLSYKTTTLDSRRRLGEAVQAMLGAVGIGVDLRSFEWPTFYDDVRRGNFQLYALAWVGANDPDFFRTMLGSAMVPPAGLNRGRYANAELDRLTERARETIDLEARRALYARVQRIVAEDLPFVPLWWSDNVVARARPLCGFVIAPDGGLEALAEARWSESCACS